MNRHADRVRRAEASCSASHCKTKAREGYGHSMDSPHSALMKGTEACSDVFASLLSSRVLTASGPIFAS